MGDGGWVPPGQQGPVVGGGARDAIPVDGERPDDGAPVDSAGARPGPTTSATSPSGLSPGPAPAPADRPTGRRRRRLIVAGVLAVAAAGLAAIVVAPRADQGSADDRSAEGPSEPAPESTAPPLSASTSVEPAEPPATETVSSPGGEFTLDLPEFWLVGFPGTGTPLAEQMVTPDAYGPDGRIEMLEDTLVTPVTRMVAIDRETWLHITPSDILLVEGMDGLDTTGRDLDELVELALPEGQGVVVRGRGRMAGAAGEMAWYEVAIDGSEQSGLTFIVRGTASVWHLTFWSDDLDVARPEAEAIAASFVPG